MTSTKSGTYSWLTDIVHTSLVISELVLLTQSCVASVKAVVLLDAGMTPSRN